MQYTTSFPRRFPLAATLCLVAIALSACGGGGGGASGGSTGSGSGTGTGNGSGTGTGSGTATARVLGTMPAEPTVTTTPTTCTPIAGGRDFQVGSGAASSNGATYNELNEVPWETLQAGDTVRIFHRATPYQGKFALFARGTAALPVRICGVKGSGGERPVIDGSGAISRTATAYQSALANTAGDRQILEALAVVMLTYDRSDYYSFPAYIQIDGLNIVRGHPSYSFTGSAGTSLAYATNSACISVRRGQHITLLDNEISDCAQAVYTISSDFYRGDDSANTQYTVSKDVRIAYNYFWNNGNVGSDREHTTYTASQGLVIEYNHYGPPKTGAGGNSIKDRSAGLVVRYNYLEEGAHSIDMVEAEDFPLTATTPNSGYEYTFVYGNLIKKSGNTGSFFHYGGDHNGSAPGANWGEPWFRQGVLYFFNNTVYGTGSGAALFQLSTTLERAEVWNNLFAFASTVGNPNLRADQGVNTTYWTSGGILNLGTNWITAGWSDSDPFHTITGQVIGAGNLMSTGSNSPIDISTFVPIAGSTVLNAAGSGPSMPTAYTANRQVTPATGFLGAPTTRNTRQDLGAIEVP